MKKCFVTCCVIIHLAICIKNVEAQSSISVPVGAMLPSGDSAIDAVFKLALSKHNSMVAPLSQSRDLKEYPILRFRVFLQQSVVNDSFLITQEFCRQISNNVQAIVGYSNRKTFPSVISYSNTFNIPWISPSLPEEKSDSPFLVVMHPRIDRFLFSFIISMNWKKLTLVYDKKEILLSMSQILDFGQKRKIDVNVRNIGREATIYQVLREISCAEEHHIIFDVGTEKAIQILNSIEELGMLSMEYHYLFTDESLVYTDTMPYGSRGTANLTFISIEQPQNSAYNRFRQELNSLTNSKNPVPSLYHRASLVYDAFSAMSLGIKNMINLGYRLDVQRNADTNNVLKCQQSPAPILVSGIDIVNSIKAVKFEGLTGNVEFNKDGERINYVINVHSLSRMGMNVVGKWRDSDEVFGSLEVNGTVRHEEILKSLQNETLVVTTILEEPYATLKSNADELSGNDRYEGFCVDLIAEITKIFPFKYRIKPVDDGQYGSKNEADNTWNGMIGEVKYQKAHMAVAPLTITSSREAVVEFTKPFMSLGISVMIKKPEKQTAHIFSFMEPLSYEIWICIVFAYIGVSVVLYLVSRFSPYEWHRRSILRTEENDEVVDSATDFGIMNSLWFSLGAFVQQGCDISPKSLSGRIVGGVWWLFTLIIISSYTANLAAFLTVDRMVSPISGAEDLAKQNTIKYGTLKSGSTVAFFKKSPLPTFEKMWAFMKSQEPSVFVKSNKEGIARVRESNGKYAFLMESTLNDYTEQRKPCNTLKVGPNIDSKGYGIALPKGSPLYDSINLAILTLREQGRLQKMKNYWWYDKSECGPNGNSAPTKTPALALSNVAGVFYILIGGMAMAIFAAVIEFCYFVAARQRKEGKVFQKHMKCAKKLGVKFDVPHVGDKESRTETDLLGLT